MMPAFAEAEKSAEEGFLMSQNRYAVPGWSYLFECGKLVSIVDKSFSMKCPIEYRKWLKKLLFCDRRDNMKASVLIATLQGIVVEVGDLDVMLDVKGADESPIAQAEFSDRAEHGSFIVLWGYEPSDRAE